MSACVSRRKVRIDSSGIDTKDEVELLKQFRANPVPVQTFLPLYRSMVKQQNLKGEISSIIRKARLLDEQKPFNFSQMNYETKISAESLGNDRKRSNSCSRIISRPKSSALCRPTSISPKMTRAAVLRSFKCRSDLSVNVEKDFHKETYDVKSILLRKISVIDDKQNFNERLKNARMMQKSRLLEYEKELMEMNERVRNRPLLVERQRQKAATSKLQKDFEKMLQKEGLNEETINNYLHKSKQSSTTGSSVTNTNTENSQYESSSDQEDANYQTHSVISDDVEKESESD